MWRSANVLDTNAPILLIEACIISENCSCVSHPETPVRWFTINSPAAQLAPEAQRLSCSSLRTRAALGQRQPQGGILGLQRDDAKRLAPRLSDGTGSARTESHKHPSKGAGSKEA